MSCGELIDSLRKAADERVLALRREAERKAEKIRIEGAQKLGALREEIEAIRHASGREQGSLVVAEAHAKARLLKLSAEKEVSDRLYGIALSRLPALRKNNYEAVFSRLAGELPPLTWKTVKVNPADAALARKYFPSCSPVPDEKISGGMDVSTADGSVRIINTFEKRLERAWRDMLPALIKDVWREVSDGTPSVAAEPRISGRVPVVED